MENPELKHWGVKGMKWGIRRYQNKDGSLTRAGKKRQVDNLEKARQAKKAKQDEIREREEKRSKLLKSTDASELYKNRDLLSTEEINERLNRLNAEQRLSQLSNQTKSTGMDKVNKALAVGRKINEVYEFTNTPVMKALKKQLGLEKTEKRLGLDKVYEMRDKLSDKQLQDALKRASTEKAIKKILDEREAERKTSTSSTESTKQTSSTENKNTKSSKTEQSKSDESLKGTVEGKGNSKSNIKNDQDQTYQKKEKPDDYYDPIDTTFSGDTTVSGVPAATRSTGSKYVNDILLIEEKYE